LSLSLIIPLSNKILKYQINQYQSLHGILAGTRDAAVHFILVLWGLVRLLLGGLKMLHYCPDEPQRELLIATYDVLGADVNHLAQKREVLGRKKSPGSGPCSGHN
jgi:hypothetical protein